MMKQSRRDRNPIAKEPDCSRLRLPRSEETKPPPESAERTRGLSYHNWFYNSKAVGEQHLRVLISAAATRGREEREKE
ncbi:hypothetical protein SAY87_024959 [Trapa incisa]|uniref:Uncharacterized protein n=1 Tax=Trapa incisa TaxID=236973 RepID=A0AAN7GAG4_9MYRT|nr:hypothetical protein SAY87_024959 [Trapa incisa]